MQVFLYKFVEHNIYCSNNFRFTERLQSASYLFKGYAIYINKNDEVTHIQISFPRRDLARLFLQFELL